MAKKKFKRKTSSSKGRRQKPFKLRFKKETIHTFASVLLFLLAGLVILSFSKQGVFLAQLFDFLAAWFGWGILFLPFFFITGGLMLTRLRWQICRPNVFLGACVLLFSFVSLTRSGYIGAGTWSRLAFLMTGLGAGMVFLGALVVGFVILFNTSLEEIILFIQKIIRFMVKVLAVTKKATPRLSLQKNRRQLNGIGKDEKKERVVITPAKPTVSTGEKKDEAFSPALVSSAGQNQVWQLPPLSILEEQIGGEADRGDINQNADIIEKTLESFGISAEVVEVNGGPAVTQYALEIALGTKLSKVTSLANDLALALAAPTGQIRIEAPIPGRSLVGVEVPNRRPEIVSLRQMLVSEDMKGMKSKLAVSLGLDVSGRPIVANIGRMPHVLIAGATGSGKSVCINSFIATILFRASPEEVKFILVDPKRVELTQYNGIPHLLSPVIHDPREVLSALEWAVSQMEERYKLFAEVGARNIDIYNEMSGLSLLPYILIIIDELADIMLFAPAKVEDTICRIAQMARATGIHLIVSTQRPSVDVITGLIKANIPCRIAFNVSSQIDSRVIIDTPGAEKLLGRGDMLYIPPDQAKPARIQGAFVSDPEVKKLIEYLKSAGSGPIYTEEITQYQEEGMAGTSSNSASDHDELYDEAVALVCRFKRASASLIQRRLKVGYARAARIIDQLEAGGVIGPSQGAKPREVLVSLGDSDSEATQ